jgi:hypothetical protein
MHQNHLLIDPDGVMTMPLYLLSSKMVLSPDLAFGKDGARSVEVLFSRLRWLGPGDGSLDADGKLAILANCGCLVVVVVVVADVAAAAAGVADVSEWVVLVVIDVGGAADTVLDNGSIVVVVLMDEVELGVGDWVLLIDEEAAAANRFAAEVAEVAVGRLGCVGKGRFGGAPNVEVAGEDAACGGEGKVCCKGSWSNKLNAGGGLEVVFGTGDGDDVAGGSSSNRPPESSPNNPPDRNLVDQNRPLVPTREDILAGLVS